MTCFIDKIQTVVDLVRDVKPYHTKIYEVQLNYNFSDQLSVVVDDATSLDANVDIDYIDNIQRHDIHAGWDTIAWDIIWKYGERRQQPIIEINPTDRYITLVDDVAYSFSMDAYIKGCSPVDVRELDAITGIITLGRQVPWSTGYAVTLECSLLYPSPIQPGGTYYAIVDGPTQIRLASSKANALANIPIIYNHYPAGTITIKALHHAVLIEPMNHLVQVTGTEYDIRTNRTKIFLTEDSFEGLTYGIINVFVDSNWDVDVDPATMGPDYRVSETTVQTTFTEQLTFDFSDVRFYDLVGVGPYPPVTELEPWGGDLGQLIVMPQAIDRSSNKFVVVGDWRYFVSTEMSTTGGLVTIRSRNQPNLTLVVESHMYHVASESLPEYTEFTVSEMPAEFQLSTQLILYSNDPSIQADIYAYWDHVWEGSTTDENTAETMISETLHITIDQDSISLSTATWDGFRWDYVGFDSDVFN